MSSSTARINGIVIVPSNDDDERNAAETQGGTNVAAPNCGRSIEELAGEDVWSDDFETAAKATNMLVLLTDDDAHPTTLSILNRLAEETANGAILLKNVEKSLDHDARKDFVDDSLVLLFRLAHFLPHTRPCLATMRRLVETLVQAMINFDNDLAALGVCSVLGIVAEGNRDFCLQMHQAGTIPLALDAMDGFGDYELLMTSCCFLLRKLFLSHDAMILQEGKSCQALSALALVKENFPNNYKIQMYTTACIDILNRL